MRTLLSGFLVAGSLFLSCPLKAFQLQVRAFQARSVLSYEAGSVPTYWNGSYLNKPAQTIVEDRASNTTTLNSLGHEFSLGTELVYPHVYMDAGLAQTFYFPGPGEKIEDLSPKLGLQFIVNVQDRWMPFARLGISLHQLKLQANRVETRPLPPALGLLASQDRFAVKREWTGNPQTWNGDLGLGCKFYPYPTTALIMEYRYSQGLKSITLHEKVSGISSFANDAGFSSERDIRGFRLNSQELSLAIETDF